MAIAISASEKKRTSKYFETSSLLKTACLLQLSLGILAPLNLPTMMGTSRSLKNSLLKSSVGAELHAVLRYL